MYFEQKGAWRFFGSTPSSRIVPARPQAGSAPCCRRKKRPPRFPLLFSVEFFFNAAKARGAQGIVAEILLALAKRLERKARFAAFCAANAPKFRIGVKL
jgi:hypothetical protein